MPDWNSSKSPAVVLKVFFWGFFCFFFNKNHFCKSY